MSKSQLKSSQVDTLYKQLKEIKYPVRPISNAMFLKKKVDTFPPAIQTQLKKEFSPELNAYRQVRGDGNCFFRAFAFIFISSKRHISWNDIFPLIDTIKLDVCKPNSIPQPFRPFYDDAKLKAVLKQRWNKDYDFFLRTTRQNSKRALSRMLNENHYLDFIIILYFRAVCLHQLKKREDFKDFLSGQADEINTYGCQSEGVTINLCSSYFHMNIRIIQVRANQVIPYDYMVLKNTFVGRNNNVHLLYSDAHYDIVQNNDDPTAEYEDEKMEEEHYSEIKYNYVKGTCFECDRNTDVSQETGLCAVCYKKSLQNFSSFQKDVTIQGQCTECNKTTKISQDLLMCQNCIQALQYSSNPIPSKIKEKPQTEPKNQNNFSKGQLCMKCLQEKSHLDLTVDNICYECIKKSKIGGQSNISQISSSEIMSLKDKLESRISRQGKKKEEEEREAGRKKQEQILREQEKRKEEQRKRVTQAQIKSKIKNPITLQCSYCKQQFPNQSKEFQENQMILCSICLALKKSQLKSASTIRSKNNNCKVCGDPGSLFPIVDGICRKCKMKKTTN